MRSIPSLIIGDGGGRGIRLASALGLCQVCRFYCSHADAPVDKLLSADMLYCYKHAVSHNQLGIMAIYGCITAFFVNRNSKRRKKHSFQEMLMGRRAFSVRQSVCLSLSVSVSVCLCLCLSLSVYLSLSLSLSSLSVHQKKKGGGGGGGGGSRKKKKKRTAMNKVCRHYIPMTTESTPHSQCQQLSVWSDNG